MSRLVLSDLLDEVTLRLSCASGRRRRKSNSQGTSLDYLLLIVEFEMPTTPPSPLIHMA